MAMAQSLAELIDEIALDAYGLNERLSGFLQVFTDEVTVPGWADDLPMGRRWFSIWAPAAFAGEVAKAQLFVEEVLDDGQWVEVRARR